MAQTTQAYTVSAINREWLAKIGFDDGDINLFRSDEEVNRVINRFKELVRQHKSIEKVVLPKCS